MALTPLMLTAMNGFLNNNAFEINSEFKQAMDSYSNKPLVKSYLEMFGYNKYYSGGPYSGITDENIMTAIKNMYVPIPFIAGLFDGTNCGVPSKYFTEYLLDWSHIIMATHRSQSHPNPTAKFIQTFQILNGFVEQMNGTINSTVNGGDVGSSTFTSMDEITTGNLSAITTDTTLFGEELLLTGKLFDFSKLRYYGTPHGLMLSLIRTKASTLLIPEFLNKGIILNDLIEAIIDVEVDMLPEVQKIIYQIFQDVTDSKLTDIMLILGVKINQTKKGDPNGISTLADLLDTNKLFPKSRSKLQTLQNGKLIPLTDANDTVSVLESIIPADIANKNINFRNSLYQLKGVLTVSTSELANNFISIESTSGLDAINQFESALPESISNKTDGILSFIADGQDENGLYFITDGIGTPCGRTHVDTLKNMNDYHISLDSIVVEEIIRLQNEILLEYNDWTIANPEPDPDDYDPPIPPETEDPTWREDWDAWKLLRDMFFATVINPLLDDLQVEIDKLPLAPSDVVNGWDNTLHQVATEKATLTEAIDWPLDFGNYPGGIGGLCGGLWNTLSVPSSKKIVLGFAESLHSLSEKTNLHGVVEVLEKLSNSNTGGNGVTGSLREGRNLKKLDDVGVITDTRISSSNPNPQPGKIKPS